MRRGIMKTTLRPLNYKSKQVLLTVCASMRIATTCASLHLLDVNGLTQEGGHLEWETLYSLTSGYKTFSSLPAGDGGGGHTDDGESGDDSAAQGKAGALGPIFVGQRALEQLYFCR